MNVSESVKKKIKEWEGLRLKAYKCPAGVLTIGYGHTGADVIPGKIITQAQADELFESDIMKFERQVAAVVGPTNLRQCQWDAIVSLAYNIGIGNFGRSTLLSKLKSYPDNPTIRAEFVRWNKAGGKVQPGLVKRRDWEARRYFGEV